MQNKFPDAHLNVSGRVHILGVCFKPDGFYPFFRIPLSEFKNQVLSTDEISCKVTGAITEKLQSVASTQERLHILEAELLLLYDRDFEIPRNFRHALKMTLQNTTSSNPFFPEENISQRQIERLFLKYVGLSANTYQTLHRFHDSMNQLLHSDYTKLSNLAYDNNYFDQMHFIREFKRYTGDTPRKFINQSNSILQIGILT